MDLRIDSARETASFGTLDGAIDRGEHLRILDGLANGERIEPVVLEPTWKHFGINGDQRGDERALITYHHDLGDEWVPAQPILKDCRGNVLAASGHDNFLLAARHPHEAIVIHVPEIAGTEPAIFGEGRLCGFLVVVVANEDVIALSKDLAFFIGSDTAAGVGTPYGSHLDGAGNVDAGGRRGFSEPVALVHCNAHCTEEVAEPLA